MRVGRRKTQYLATGSITSQNTRLKRKAEKELLRRKWVGGWGFLVCSCGLLASSWVYELFCCVLNAARFRVFHVLLVLTRSYSFLLKDAWLRGFRGLGFTSLFHICGSLLHLWSSGSQVGATSARLRQGNH